MFAARYLLNSFSCVYSLSVFAFFSHIYAQLRSNLLFKLKEWTGAGLFGIVLYK